MNFKNESEKTTLVDETSAEATVSTIQSNHSVAEISDQDAGIPVIEEHGSTYGDAAAAAPDGAGMPQDEGAGMPRATQTAGEERAEKASPSTDTADTGKQALPSPVRLTNGSAWWREETLAAPSVQVAGENDGSPHGPCSAVSVSDPKIRTTVFIAGFPHWFVPTAAIENEMRGYLQRLAPVLSLKVISGGRLNNEFIKHAFAEFQSEEEAMRVVEGIPGSAFRGAHLRAELSRADRTLNFCTRGPVQLPLVIHLALFTPDERRSFESLRWPKFATWLDPTLVKRIASVFGQVEAVKELYPKIFQAVFRQRKDFQRAADALAAVSLQTNLFVYDRRSYRNMPHLWRNPGERYNRSFVGSGERTGVVGAAPRQDEPTSGVIGPSRTTAEKLVQKPLVMEAANVRVNSDESTIQSQDTAPFEPIQSSDAASEMGEAVGPPTVIPTLDAGAIDEDFRAQDAITHDAIQADQDLLASWADQTAEEIDTGRILQQTEDQARFDVISEAPNAGVAVEERAQGNTFPSSIRDRPRRNARVPFRNQLSPSAVRPPRPFIATSTPSTVKYDEHSIWVGNLPNGIDEPSIRGLFARYGQIHLVQTHKNFAFVSFEVKESAAKAIEQANGTVVCNCNILVRPKQRKMPWRSYNRPAVGSRPSNTSPRLRHRIPDRRNAPGRPMATPLSTAATNPLPTAPMADQIGLAGIDRETANGCGQPVQGAANAGAHAGSASSPLRWFNRSAAGAQGTGAPPLEMLGPGFCPHGDQQGSPTHVSHPASAPLPITFVGAGVQMPMPSQFESGHYAPAMPYGQGLYGYNAYHMAGVPPHFWPHDARAYPMAGAPPQSPFALTNPAVMGPARPAFGAHEAPRVESQFHGHAPIPGASTTMAAYPAPIFYPQHCNSSGSLPRSAPGTPSSGGGYQQAYVQPFVGPGVFPPHAPGPNMQPAPHAPHVGTDHVATRAAPADSASPKPGDQSHTVQTRNQAGSLPYGLGVYNSSTAHPTSTVQMPLQAPSVPPGIYWTPQSSAKSQQAPFAMHDHTQPGQLANYRVGPHRDLPAPPEGPAAQSAPQAAADSSAPSPSSHAEATQPTPSSAGPVTDMSEPGPSRPRHRARSQTYSGGSTPLHSADNSPSLVHASTGHARAASGASSSLRSPTSQTSEEERERHKPVPFVEYGDYGVVPRPGVPGVCYIPRFAVDG